VGALIIVPLLIWMKVSYIFLLFIAIIAGPRIRKLFQGRNQEEWKVYHTCTGRQRLYASGAWIALVMLLVFGMVLSAIGARYPENPMLGMGMLIEAVGCAGVGGICFFTWPLAKEGSCGRPAVWEA
jgi:hypothetical protein